VGTVKYWLYVALLVASTGILPEPGHADDLLRFWDDRISLGGEIRGRGEVFGNFYTTAGSSDLDDERLLLRSRLHLDVHPDDSWRVYLEAQDSREFGSDLISRYAVPNGFEDDLDLFQGYLELNHISGSPLSLRVGRQVLSYGEQRLLGGFNWSNVARSFDAVKLGIDLEAWNGQIDIFAGEEAIHDWGEFNDPLRSDSTLYGIYSTWKERFGLDFIEAYYLLDENDDTETSVHTFGTRLGNQYENHLDWEIELAGQFGEFNDLDHAAFASHAELGYTFQHPVRPRVALAYNYATGDDDPLDGDHETFYNLYPTNHLHYGQMDLFSWRNLHDIELNVSKKPLENLTTVAELHFFLLDEPGSDAWYNAGGAVQRRAAAGSDPDAYVGTELDLRLIYRPIDWLALEGGYSHFFAGGYVDDTGESDDADWGYLMATVTF
jgi:hypothetical protein